MDTDDIEFRITQPEPVVVYPDHELQRLTQFTRYDDIEGMRDTWTAECECGQTFKEKTRQDVRDVHAEHAFDAVNAL